ncbi:Protein CBG12419 [Caenorhabditis briggsae]|uniref:Protein CBG12419 n=1 Tax=Caenorhabditis briggsae TaxID=6238 RepID=A8XFE1_CAEBR|nr:Protein CBG12419 [Caenorhabditis briggsae]CAP31402.2 Protein CBG12419 [Caenorhabditis briggsae]
MDTANHLMIIDASLQHSVPKTTNASMESAKSTMVFDTFFLVLQCFVQQVSSVQQECTALVDIVFSCEIDLFW